MRFPVPERFPPKAVFIFATLIFVGQLIEGTDFLFAVLTAAFIGIWATAFNISGGMVYTSGAYIFFNGLLTAVLGVTAKVLLFQAGDRHLRAPRSLMICYCIAMAGMGGMSFLARGLRPATGLLKDFDSLNSLKRAAVTCLIAGSIVFAITSSGGGGEIGSALRQINRFPLMAILLGTIYEIRRSNGRRSINWIVVTAGMFETAMGLINFTKEGMLIGGTAWFLAAVLMNYNFSKRQLFACVAAVSFMVYYLVPYSQLVRNYGTTTTAGNIAVSLVYLSDLNKTRQTYLDAVAEYDIAEEYHLFDQREPFLDRAIMMAPDDALISYTNKGNVFGLTPTFTAYANIVPRIIWHNKPSVSAGNIYGHEIGILAEEDDTTGISFSPAADAYHEEKWLALMVLLPLDMFLLFLICDTVAGSAKHAPWAFLWIIEVSHLAPEAGLQGCVYLFTYAVISMLLVYWTTKVAGPFVMKTLGMGSTNQPKTVSSNTRATRTLDTAT